MLLANGADAAALHPFHVVAVGYFQQREDCNVTWLELMRRMEWQRHSRMLLVKQCFRISRVLCVLKPSQISTRSLPFTHSLVHG